MSTHTRQQPGTADSGSRTKTGNTTSNVAHRRVPRLPHERDESADSQELQEPEQHGLMQQAHDDLQQGLEDTDRGPVLDKVYREKLKQPRKR